jgi:alpha-tubulin suppressor-like RCC1 family protein
VSVGANHACAIQVNSVAVCWGLNTTGQLGEGTLVQRTTPYRVRITAGTFLSGVTAISAGGTHTCATVGAGASARVRCWGADSSGQLGNTATGVQRFAVTVVSGSLANGASSLAAGTSHTLVVAPNAQLTPTAVIGWGANTSGQLGDGTATNRPAPTRNSAL